MSQQGVSRRKKLKIRLTQFSFNWNCLLELSLAKRKKKERIMPSLVATTSAPARTTCVSTHYVRTIKTSPLSGSEAAMILQCLSLTQNSKVVKWYKHWCKLSYWHSLNIGVNTGIIMVVNVIVDLVLKNGCTYWCTHECENWCKNRINVIIGVNIGVNMGVNVCVNNTWVYTLV